MEDGITKKVTETFVVNAFSFTEAEKNIIEKVSPFVSGEFSVEKITKASYKEIVLSEKPKANGFYKVKVAFVTLDEKSGKEKRTNFNMLVNDESLNGAITTVDEAMRGSMTDYVSLNASTTKIVDFFVNEV